MKSKPIYYCNIDFRYRNINQQKWKYDTIAKQLIIGTSIEDAPENNKVYRYIQKKIKRDLSKLKLEIVKINNIKQLGNTNPRFKD